MKSVIQYALSLTGICINMDDKVTKEWLDYRSVFHKLNSATVGCIVKISACGNFNSMYLFVVY
jgi:hypothetical protein